MGGTFQSPFQSLLLGGWRFPVPLGGWHFPILFFPILFQSFPIRTFLGCMAPTALPTVLRHHEGHEETRSLGFLLLFSHDFPSCSSCPSWFLNSIEIAQKHAHQYTSPHRWESLSSWQSLFPSLHVLRPSLSEAGMSNLIDCVVFDHHCNRRADSFCVGVAVFIVPIIPDVSRFLHGATSTL